MFKFQETKMTKLIGELSGATEEHNITWEKVRNGSIYSELSHLSNANEVVEAWISSNPYNNL